MVIVVEKAEGGIEEYLHTKVLLCISNALCAAGEFETSIAERLAEAITSFVYGSNLDRIASTQIFSMVRIVLSETGWEEASNVLAEHTHRRKLCRSRIEVVDAELLEMRDADAMMEPGRRVRQWSKGLVARQVMDEFGLEQQLARAVAARVEERVLAMSMSRVWSGLVRQLIISEAAAIIRTEASLRVEAGPEMVPFSFEADEVRV
jgi:hypothetical protein